MFNLLRLEVSLVRLCALFQAKVVRRIQVKDVAIANPYLIYQNNLGTEAIRDTMKKYLLHFMVANNKNYYLLVLYYPM